MSTNDLVLDFTSPGTIPPDPTEVVKRVIDETRTTMQTLETLLETEQIEDTTGWKLLAMFYLATGRMGNLTKIEDQYRNLFGTSLFADLKQGYPQWCEETVSSPVRFEVPRKITAAALPDIAMIQDACHSPGGALLDFSRVQEIDSDGLRKLAEFFSSLSQSSVKPQIQQAERFIAYLENEAESHTGTCAIWEVLFAYERFCNNREAFEDRAIRFAVCYGISPPSWE